MDASFCRLPDNNGAVGNPSGDDGQVIAVSEGYKALASCENGIESVKKNAESEVVEE